MLHAAAVIETSQIAEARRMAMAAARSAGLNQTERARAAIVVTELATNLIKHGGGGEILTGGFSDNTGAGLQCLAIDKGKGMASIAVCMEDGYSTAGTAGCGLGMARRQSHVFEVYSAPAKGTVIIARLYPAANVLFPPLPASCGGAYLLGACHSYPGLVQHHPALIAAVLYRDGTRGPFDYAGVSWKAATERAVMP